MTLLRILCLVLAGVSASVHARQSPAPQRWSLVEVWRSGGDPTSSLSFAPVVDLELAPNGQLLALTGGPTPQLAWIDNTGRPIRVVGGPRSGPMALDAPNGLVQFPDGRIVINDPRVGRFVVLSESGRFLRDVDYQPWGWSARWMAFVGTDGALYDFIADGPRLVWRRWAPDFSSSRLVPASSCDPGITAARADTSFHLDGPTPITIPVPFLQPLISFVRAPDGASWTGAGPDFRRIVHTPWGECEDDVEVRLSGEALQLPDDVRAREVERIRRLAQDTGARTMPDTSRIPNTIPLFHTLRVDRQHRLWVERHVTPDTRGFSVFDPDGRARAEIPVIPTSIDTERPVAFSDNHVFYFTTDDSGWTWLVAMRIERVG